MKSASITEAKAKLSALLDRVRAGETVTITDRGRPVARIVPAVGAVDDDGRLARLERSGLVRPPLHALDLDAFAAQSRATSRASVLEVLLEERRTSDR